jgi:hypothetical protein
MIIVENDKGSFDASKSAGHIASPKSTFWNISASAPEASSRQSDSIQKKFKAASLSP